MTGPKEIFYEGCRYTPQLHLSEPGWMIFQAAEHAPNRDYQWLVALYYKGMRPRRLVYGETAFNYASYPLCAAFLRRRKRVAKLARRSALEGIFPGSVDRFKLIGMSLDDVLKILEGRKNKSDFFHPDSGFAALKSQEEWSAELAKKRAQSRSQVVAAS
jgi:hypothetical protein